MRSADITGQLDRLEEEGVLDVDTVDFTAPDPVRVARELGPALDYFARVEREVERNLLEIAAFVPRADDTTQRFVKIWSDQELPHGEVFERLIADLGMPPSTPALDRPNVGLRAAGRLSFIPGVHDVLMFLYLSMGAMHERLTAIGYDKLRERLLERGMRGFVNTAIGPIRKQESGHYAYYRNSALLLRDRMSNWQLHLARALRIWSYQPIGVRTQLTAGAPPAAFGRTATILTGKLDLHEFAVPVQRVAQELLVREGQGLRLPPFVAKALRETVEALPVQLRGPGGLAATP